MNDAPLVVNILKGVMTLVMLGGGIAVFRELIPMARGKSTKSKEQRTKENNANL